MANIQVTHDANLALPDLSLAVAEILTVLKLDVIAKAGSMSLTPVTQRRKI